MKILRSHKQPLIRLAKCLLRLVPDCVSTWPTSRPLLTDILSGLLVCFVCLTAQAAEKPPPEETPIVTFTVKTFKVDGDNPLPADVTQEALSLYLGEHGGLDGLLAAADALEKQLRVAGYSFHRVSLPGQTLADGVVLLRVIEFKVANIEISGNEFFSPENLLRSLPELRTGTAPNTDRLGRSVALANEHPAKRIDLTFSESKQESSVNAKLKVKDERVWNVFSSLDNTGTAATGNYRLSLGAQHTNLFDRDHVLTMSYSTSPGHFDDVKQLGINYQIPFYSLASKLTLTFSDSDVNSGQVADFFTVSGAGRVYAARLVHKFLRRGKYDHSLTIGAEDKLFVNNIDFLGAPIGVDVRSTPASVTYNGLLQSTRSRFDFRVSFARNLGLRSNNDSATYAASRSGANANWQALRYKFNGDYYLDGGWVLRGRIDGQWANEPLIAGEQFGIGGARSVRGFAERDVTGDRGFSLGGELWSPPVAKLNNLRVVGFIEGGQATVERPAAGQLESVSIASGGLGIRFQFKKYLSGALDVAHVINDGGTEADGATNAHFSLFARY